MKAGKYPNTRKGWAEYYFNKYDREGRPIQQAMAFQFLLMYEAFGETPPSEI